MTPARPHPFRCLRDYVKKKDSLIDFSELYLFLLASFISVFLYGELGNGVNTSDKLKLKDNMINKQWNGSNMEEDGRAVIWRVHPVFSCSCGIQSRKLQDSRSQSPDLILGPSAPAVKLNYVIHLSSVASVYKR